MRPFHVSPRKALSGLLRVSPTILRDLLGDKEQIPLTFISSVPGKEPGSLYVPSERFGANTYTLTPIKFSRNVNYCHYLVTKMATVNIKVN